MSRQVSLLVTLGSTMLGVLGWSNNPNLLAQPIPSSSFAQTQTSFSNSLPSSEPLSEEIEGQQIQEYGEPQRSKFNPRLEQLEDKASDSSSFSPVNSVPEILDPESEEKLSSPLESSLTVDSSNPKKATIRLGDSCSTQKISDSNSSSPQNAEAQKFLPNNNSCFAEPSLRASDLGFSQRKEKLTTPEIFSQSSIAEENSDDRNSEIDLDQPSNSTKAIDSGNDQDWQFKFQLFAPIPITTYGNATIKGRRVDYQLNLGEALDILKFAATGRFEAWKGDLGFIVSGYYANLRGSSGIREFTRLPNVTVVETLKFRQGIYDFALSYHFGDRPQYNPTEQPSNKSFPLAWFEPMIGTRLNDINTSIDAELDLGRLGRRKQPRFEKGRTWFEPLIGGKLGVQVSDPLTFWVRGDASGFGLAGDTDISWNIVAGGDWRVHRNVSLQLGYYFYHIDYQNGSGNNTFGYEQSQNGPYLSATFHF